MASQDTITERELAILGASDVEHATELVSSYGGGTILCMAAGEESPMGGAAIPAVVFIEAPSQQVLDICFSAGFNPQSQVMARTLLQTLE